MQVLLIILFLCATFVTAIPFEDCGSAYHLESVDISDCETYPCSLTVGSTVTVTANILVQSQIRSKSQILTQDVYFVVNNVRQVAHAYPDPCTAVYRSRDPGHNSCELENGQHLKYTAMLTVNNLPPLPATLYWKLQNEDAKTVVCYKVTVLLKY